MPAKAGIQKYLIILDSRFRGNDANGRIKTFYDFIKIENSKLPEAGRKATSLPLIQFKTKNSKFKIDFCIAA